MTSRRLVIHWLIGLSALALAAWGPPPWLRSAAETAVPGARGARERTERLRRDSARAMALAPLERTAAGDSVRAIVFVPPDPLGYERRQAKSDRTIRFVLMALIPLLLMWNSWLWWRGRSGRQTAVT